MAAPTFVSVVNAQATATASATLGTTAADDILIQHAGDNAAGLFAAPGGTYAGGAWTTLYNVNDADIPSEVLRWSRCTGDHSTQTVTQAEHTDGTSLSVSLWRGCLTTATPVDVSAESWFASEPADWTPGLTTTVDETLVLFGHLANTNTSPSWSAQTMGGSAMTEQVDYNASVPTLQHGLATLEKTTAGALGAFDATWNITSTNDRRLFAIALKPPAADAPRRAPTLGAGAAAQHAATWCKRRSILVPRLWLPQGV